MIEWRPERAGDAVEGVVTAVGHTTSLHTSDPIPVVHLRTGTGEQVAVNCFASGLRAEVSRVHPRIGDRFAVRYDGKRVSVNARKVFHEFRCSVEAA